MLAMAMFLAGAAVGAAGGYVLAQSGAPSSWQAAKLEDKGVRAGADSGNPLVRMKVLDKGNTLGAGIWECKPGGFPVKNRPSTENVYIISGNATITDSDGACT